MTEPTTDIKPTDLNQQQTAGNGNDILDEENYVCDIAFMKIDDNDGIADDKEDDKLRDSSPREGQSLMAPLYLNEVEIDHTEEEQTITELVEATGQQGVIETGQNYRLRVAFGIILRLVLPLANGVARGIKGIRDVRFLRLMRSIASSRQAFTNLVAFAANTISMNLSSVQGCFLVLILLYFISILVINNSKTDEQFVDLSCDRMKISFSTRIEPILKLMKIRKSRDGVESLPDVPLSENLATTTPSDTPITATYSPFIREPNASRRKTPAAEQAAPKCCTLNVLAEPPPGVPIRADIVLIHGLHGSLVNTWKQGLWENERHPVEFERPPKPPVRPPKRPLYTRSALIHPPHKQKRARFAHSDLYKQSCDKNSQDEAGDGLTVRSSDDSNDVPYVCSTTKHEQSCDGVEYNLPTFRLRVNDNGRQLQKELEGKHRDAHQDIPKNSNKKNKTTPKPTCDDPDYSKCWPGDWLPLDCPGVRVIAVNYTTDQYLWRPLWKKKEPRTNLIQRSREMAELLIEHRVGYGHPIVWVGHSKGGLFVKQIIVDAWESGRPSMAPFWRSSRGCFFYSVPHRGAHLANIKAPLLTRSVELLDIEKNNKYLLDLHRRFAGLYHLGLLKIEVFSFVETALTLMSVLYLRIVGVDSADPGIGDVCGIRLDHREICKPRSRDCILYKELVKMIKKVC